MMRTGANLYMCIALYVGQVTATIDGTDSTDGDDSVSCSIQRIIQCGIFSLVILVLCTNDAIRHIDINVWATNHQGLITTAKDRIYPCCRDDVNLRVTIWSS